MVEQGIRIEETKGRDPLPEPEVRAAEARKIREDRGIWMGGGEMDVE